MGQQVGARKIEEFIRTGKVLVHMVGENKVKLFSNDLPRISRHPQAVMAARKGSQGFINFQTMTCPPFFLKPVQGASDTASVIEDPSLRKSVRLDGTEIQPRDKTLKLGTAVIPPSFMNFHRFALGPVQGGAVEGFQAIIGGPGLLEQGPTRSAERPF